MATVDSFKLGGHCTVYTVHVRKSCYFCFCINTNITSNVKYASRIYMTTQTWQEMIPIVKMSVL